MSGGHGVAAGLERARDSLVGVLDLLVLLVDLLDLLLHLLALGLGLLALRRAAGTRDSATGPHLVDLIERQGRAVAGHEQEVFGLHVREAKLRRVGRLRAGRADDDCVLAYEGESGVQVVSLLVRLDMELLLDVCAVDVNARAGDRYRRPRRVLRWIAGCRANA